MSLTQSDLKVTHYLSLSLLFSKCYTILGFLHFSNLGQSGEKAEPRTKWSLVAAFHWSPTEFSKYNINAFPLIWREIGKAINNINFLLIWISTIISPPLICCTFIFWCLIPTHHHPKGVIFLNLEWQLILFWVILHKKYFKQNFPHSNF